MDAIDWTSRYAAYGAATRVPGLVAALADSDEAQRAAAVDELCGTVWHQGTVYDASPAVVPSLVAVLTDRAGDARTRAHVAFLLALIASPDSFCLPPGAPSRNLPAECHDAVAACGPSLVQMLNDTRPVTRAGLLAALAAIAATLSAQDLARIERLDVADDRWLAAAVPLVRSLARREVTEEVMRLAADVDEEAADVLDGNPSPLAKRGVDLVIALCERSAAAHYDA